MRLERGPESLRDFWGGRRVFLTGHTGFKGAWLSLWLQHLGAEATGYSLPPPTEPSLFELTGVANGMRSIPGDVRDPASLASACEAARPEVVIHMAAQALVRRSYDDPVGTYSTNVLGTVHLLEAVRSVGGVRAVVVVTTDKCYENREWPWPYREVDALGGRDPYASSKAGAELAVAAYRDSFFPPQAHASHGTAVASARAGNVIGGGDWAPDRLVPDLMKGFMAGEPVPVRNPDSVRPWQHVLEPLSGYLLLAERLYSEGVAFGEAWNFAPREEDSRTVSWIADYMAGHWGGGARWERDRGTHPYEAHSLRLDWSKARERLGWAPRWSLEGAVERVVAWYRTFASRPSAARLRDTTLAEIEEYEVSAPQGRG